MQQILRPMLTSSVAVAVTGAALITGTAAATAPQLLGAQHRAVELTTAAASAADATNLGLISITDGHIGLFPLGPMADLFGLGGLKLSEIVDFLGLGDDKLSTLLPGLVDGLGIGKTTLGTLVGDLGMTDTALAPLLNGLVNGLGLDNTTLGSLVDGLGLGDEQVGTLVNGLVSGLGLGDTSLDQLVDGLGLGTVKLGALAPIITDLANAVPSLNDVTFGDVVGGLDLSNVQLSTLLGDLGGSQVLVDLLKVAGAVPGIGSITTVGGLLGAAGLTDAPVFDGLEKLLADPNAGIGGVDVSSALDSLGLGHATLNELLGAVPLHMTVDSLLGGLNLDDATLGDLLGSGLIPSGATVGGLLDSLGLAGTSLDTLISGLNNSGLSVLGDSLDDLLSDTGVGNATLDGLLEGTGLYDHALFTF